MMALKDIDLEKELSPLTWCVDELFLRGYINTIASLPGEGKTALLTGLAWQLSRPEGCFLDRQLSQGNTLYVDFDAPGDGRSLRYWLDKHKQAFPDGDINRIRVLEPDDNTYGLGEAEIGKLVSLAEEMQADLILIDSFSSAFPTTDPVKLVQVQGPLWHLRKLATETNAAVVILDHLPKPVNGEKAGARGVIGSVAKSAQARAVHILSRIPASEIGGRNVLRWDVTKMSYSSRTEPFGVELRFDQDAVFVERIALPQAHSETRTARAVRAVQDYLEARRGEVVPHAIIIDVAITEGGLRKRTAAEVLRLVKQQYGADLSTLILPGRGKPQGYCLAIETKLDDKPIASLHQMGKSSSETASSLTQTPLHLANTSASNEPSI